MFFCFSLEEQIITEVFLDAENVHDLEEVFIKLEASPAKQTEDKSIEKPRKKYTYKNKAEENYCPKCDKDFDTTSEFKLHKQQHLKEAQRKKHKLNYKSTKKIQFFCSTCNKGFTTKTELIKHKKEHATLSKIKVVKAVKAKVNYCSKCNKDFDTTSEIKLHRQQHVKENKSKNHKLHYKPKRKIQFFCSTCNQGFTTKKGLRKHKREHVTPHVEPENCLLCGIEFEYPTVLIKHLANDHLTDNLECSQCKKKFRFAISLFRHLKEHLNPGKNLNFFCKHCGKGNLCD